MALMESRCQQLVTAAVTKAVEGLAGALFTEYEKIRTVQEGGLKEIGSLKAFRGIVAGHMAQVRVYLGMAENRGGQIVFDDMLQRLEKR